MTKSLVNLPQTKLKKTWRIRTEHLESLVCWLGSWSSSWSWSWACSRPLVLVQVLVLCLVLVLFLALGSGSTPEPGPSPCAGSGSAPDPGLGVSSVSRLFLLILSFFCHTWSPGYSLSDDITAGLQPIRLQVLPDKRSRDSAHLQIVFARCHGNGLWPAALCWVNDIC